VGTRGEAFVLYCLSTDEPGRPVENPRQIPAYRYSRRWGPLPPCFARATVLGPSLYRVPVALLGGTASIRGEDSLHVGDSGRQIEETLRNLAALVRAAAGESGVEDAAALACIREVRVYHPREEDEAQIRSAVEAACPRLRHLEMLRAELCRRELLVEIEGVAEV
jgi:enamine deaminase RidA (YjgF/YER057c/UK114 family)